MIVTEEGINVLAALKLASIAMLSVIGPMFAALGMDSFAIGSTLAVSATFAGLILRQVIKNQNAIWEIVAEKDRQLYRAALREEYLTWEREQARFRGGERTDPGPFIPMDLSPKTLPQETDTMN